MTGRWKCAVFHVMLRALPPRFPLPISTSAFPMSTPAALTEAQVREQLRVVKYPGFSRDIVSFGIVKDVQIAPNGRDVTVFIEHRHQPARRRPANPPGSHAPPCARCRASARSTCVSTSRTRPPPPDAASARAGSRASGTSSPWPAARAASANPPWRPTSPSPCGAPGRASASAIATSTARASR